MSAHSVFRALKPPRMTFGEWLRWTIARREITRPELARLLKVSERTVTNLYSRADPEGIADVTISRLAALLGMSEPELMVSWKQGLPTVKTDTKKKK